MKIRSILKYTLTLGGEYRFQLHKKEYEKLYTEYQEYYEKFKPIIEYTQNLKDNIEKVVLKIKKIFEEFNLEKFVDEKNKVDTLKHPERFALEKNYNSVAKKEVISVVSASVALPMATYQLIATFGTASTGMAISSIPLVVQPGTILSFLGGGSIASGGLGIAVGQFVLPALALLPVSYFVVKSHKSANVYKSKTKELKKILSKKYSDEKILSIIEKLQENIATFTKKESEFEVSLMKLCDDFAQDILPLLNAEVDEK